MLKVYHTKDWNLNTQLHFIKEAELAEHKFNLEDYELVAIVHSDDKEIAFQYTNTIDRYWWENSREIVTPYKTETRSTSVGDLLEDETEQLWLCAGCGWEKVEWSNCRPERHTDDSFTSADCLNCELETCPYN